jgi:hypothetical protein
MREIINARHWWIQTAATRARERGNHHLSAERACILSQVLDEAGEGFKLYPALDPAPADLRVKKKSPTARSLPDRRSSTTISGNTVSRRFRPPSVPPPAVLSRWISRMMRRAVSSSADCSRAGALDGADHARLHLPSCRGLSRTGYNDSSRARLLPEYEPAPGLVTGATGANLPPPLLARPPPHLTKSTPHGQLFRKRQREKLVCSHCNRSYVV